MKVTCHLLLQANYYYRSDNISSISVARVTKNKPTRKANQIAVKLDLDIPDNTFDDYIPELAVKATLDDLLKPSIQASLGYITEDGLDELSNLLQKEINKRRKEGEKDALDI